MNASTAAKLAVTVAYAAPGVEVLVVLELPAGATVDDAVAHSGIVARFDLDASQLEFAIFGQRAKGATPLVDGDRVELTRALVADPKRVRRRRAASNAKRKPARAETLRR
jgi:putative ubiquitin-RnfH superfamily antitoxin RatB of RatAB toxin-antitoxin module